MYIRNTKSNYIGAGAAAALGEARLRGALWAAAGMAPGRPQLQKVGQRRASTYTVTLVRDGRLRHATVPIVERPQDRR